MRGLSVVLRQLLPLVMFGCGAARQVNLERDPCSGTSTHVCTAIQYILLIPQWHPGRRDPGTPGYYGSHEFSRLIHAVCHLRVMPDEILGEAIRQLDNSDAGFPWANDSRLFLLNRAMMEFPSALDERRTKCLIDCATMRPGIRPLSVGAGGWVGFAFGYDFLESPFPYDASSAFERLVREYRRRPASAFPGECRALETEDESHGG